jgi:hypothetical protein
VPILDEEQFERYLKEFRPVPPGSLQVARRPSAARRPFAFMAWAAACAASLVLAFLLLSHRTKPDQPSSASSGLTVVPQLSNTQSLTIGRANALLSHAPSFKEAVDQLSFQPQAAPPSKGKQSALSVLSKENIKL